MLLEDAGERGGASPRASASILGDARRVLGASSTSGSLRQARDAATVDLRRSRAAELTAPLERIAPPAHDARERGRAARRAAPQTADDIGRIARTPSAASAALLRRPRRRAPGGDGRRARWTAAGAPRGVILVVDDDEEQPRHARAPARARGLRGPHRRRTARAALGARWRQRRRSTWCCSTS